MKTDVPKNDGASLTELRTIGGRTPALSAISAGASGRYDAVTVALHWITAALVLFQFSAGELWDFFPRPRRHVLIQLHISVGLILIAVILIRILWRRSRGQALPSVGGTRLAAVARCTHYVLYLALIGMAGTGVLMRWMAAQPVGFFWLFTIQSPLKDLEVWHHRDARLHSIGAWVFVSVIGLHASAALIHHYILRDGVLSRMAPFRHRAP